MPSGSDDVHAAIAAAGGAIRFDEYMRIALYGDHGFYTSAGRSGRRGDFITSPEVGPLFGTVLVRWIDAEWERLGRPDDFTIVECGAGPGTLARSVLAAAPQWAGRYVAVEASAAQRRDHPAGVVSTAAMPAGPLTGVVVANELLDNLPFRLAVYDGGWREAVVTESSPSRFAEELAPGDPDWHWLPAVADHGARLPIQDAAGAWVDAARQTVGRGSVIALDYCTSRTADLAGRPWREWLRTYRGHERVGHYLLDPGSQDITAQVCIDQLPAPDGLELQADFLRRWGIEALVDEGRQAWSAAAAAPDLAAVRMRSRVAESEALLDRGGLGGFHVLSWRSTATPNTDRGR